MREVIMNQKTNLLQLEEHFYQLVDVAGTKCIPAICFHMMEIPKIAFNDRIVPHNMPEEYLDHRYDIPGWTAVKGSLYNGTDRDHLRLFT